jgi:hypothetical protein
MPKSVTGISLQNGIARNAIEEGVTLKGPKIGATNA